jgi:hypothetical protein
LARRRLPARFRRRPVERCTHRESPLRLKKVKLPNVRAVDGEEEEAATAREAASALLQPLQSLNRLRSPNKPRLESNLGLLLQ